MGETLPPLRVREPDGSPNVIPVYDMIMSTNLVVQNRGGGVIALSATTGAGAGTVYAATGNSYIVTDFATDLTGEFRLVQSGNSITINTASNLIIINAVTNAAASNIVYAATGNSYVVTDLAADLTGEFRLVQSGNSITIDTTGNLIIINAATGITQLVYAQTGDTFLVYSASTGMSAERVIAASDNITIVSSGTSFLISANTGNWAPIGGEYLVYAANASLTAERVIAASDNITIVSSGTSFLISANTGAGGGGTQIIRIPMALLTVEVNSGNAFWTAQTDTTRMDKAYVNMVDSGRSVSTWWTMVPTNVNATPAWSVDIFSEAATLAATGGFLVLNVDGMSVATGESANTLAASTVNLVAAGSFLLNTAGLMTMTTMSATNFDGTLATSAMDYMKVKITRQGNADTFNSDWYIYSVNLKCTVDT